MKASSLAPALLAATLFLATGLRAEDAPAAEMNGASDNQTMSKQRQAEILKRFDKNGDGKLDDAEKAAAKEQNREGATSRQKKMRDRAMAKFDKNGDGKLDETERAEAIKAAETNPRLLKRFDKDGDGKLNDAEKAAAREAFVKMGEKRAGKKD